MIPFMSYLNREQLEKLHQSGIAILQKFGMRVEDPAMRDLLVQNGCTAEGERVKFSEDLIEKAVQNQKKQVTMTARNGASVDFRLGNTYSHSTGGAPWIADPVTGKRRNGMLTDLIDTIHIMNQLDSLTIPCALVYPSDVPAAVSQLTQTATMLKYSRKPIYGPGVSTADNAKYIVELFKLYGGSKLAENPIGMVGVSPESPLFLPKEITDTMKHIIGAGIPTSILAAPMGGLTAPVTVVGCVAQAHAEILGFASLAYLINPDCVLFYGSRTFFANMKNGQSILGLPETGISSAICAQLATHLGWMSDVYGLSCTSCAMDEQAGYEKMMNALLPAMAGATLITGFGSTASVMCCSLSQLVIDDDILSMIYRSRRAAEISDDILGFDAIDCVVNEGETLLEQEHTVEYLMEKEIFNPYIGFDSVWADWLKRGEVPLSVNAQKRAQELLEKDAGLPVDDTLDKEAEKILAAAKTELLK